MRPLLDRVPPHDEEAERGVLGSMLLEPRAVRIACELLTGDDFYLKANRELFAVLRDLAARGQPIDELIVRVEMGKRGLLANAGGFRFLGDIITGTPNAANIESYCQVVLEKSAARKLQLVCTQALISLYEGDLIEAIEHARCGVLSIVRDLVYCSEDGVGKQIEDAISGKRVSVTLPWPKLSYYANPLTEGSISILCGNPGSGKSFMAIQAFAYWLEENVTCALLELEDGKTYHLRRLTAQRAGNSRITEDLWCKENGAEAREYVEAQREFVERAGQSMDEMRDRISTGKVLAWLAGQVEQGVRVAMVDPITARDPTAKPWIDDHQFMRGAEAILRGSRTSFLMLAHPPKSPMGGPTSKMPANVAGGAAFERLSHTVLHVYSLPEPEKVMCAGDMGATEHEINRKIRLTKTRDGRGQGLQLGFWFDHATLRMSERGAIKPRAKI